MAKIDPPSPALLEELQRMSRSMLSGLGYTLDSFHIRDARMHAGEETIFKNLNDDLKSYGTITARALDEAQNKTVFIVAPATDANVQHAQDHTLLLMPSSLLVQPEYREGHELGLVEATGSKWLPPLRLIVHERKVVLNDEHNYDCDYDDNEPYYTYRLRLKKRDERAWSEGYIKRLVDTNVQFI